MNDTPQKPTTPTIPVEDAALGTPGRPTLAQKIMLRLPLVAYMLVVIAVLVIVNVLANSHDKGFDLTKGHFNSLSPESANIVKDLKQPLQVLYFDRPGSFDNARAFFARYQRESNKFELQYIDPDRSPDKARAAGIQTYGTTVIESDGRKQIVTSLTEQDVTNAIVRVLKGEKKTVYFLAGEGERDPDDSGRTGYSAVKDALTADNFTVQKLVLAQSPKVPDDCAVLVVAGPVHPFVAPEVQAIQNFVDGGGRVFFMLNYQQTGPLVDYLQNSLNVKMAPNDVVLDMSGVGRIFGAGPELPIVAKYDEHPITQQMSESATLFPLARSMTPAANPGSRAVVSPLFETGPESVAVTDLAVLQSGGGDIDPSKALKGPFTLGVAGTLATTANSGAHAGDSTEARYVVVGSADFALNNYLNFNGNRDLFLNIMNWLSAQEAFITIRPQAPQNSPISMSAAQMSRLGWTFFAGLPLAIVILGVGVWWRRRAS